MSHQQALAQVTAQAVLAQSQMHLQADFQPSAEPMVGLPSYTSSEASEQKMAPSVSDPKSAKLEVSETSHADKKYQSPPSLGID